MKTFINFLAFLCLGLTFSNCNKEKGDPVLEINTNLELPAGSFQVDPATAEVDNSVSIVNNNPGTVGALNVGTQNNMQISFNAPNGNVTAAGMRFGANGPINFVPVPSAQGNTSGTMSIPFTVSAATCNNLSKVCHDIQCYEFAMTADGKITQSNIRDVALMCGNCDEPSCKDLIDPPCPPGIGEGTFTIGNQTYSGFGSCISSTLGSGTDVVLIDNNINNPAFTFVIYMVPNSGSANLSDDWWNSTCSNCPFVEMIDNNNFTSWTSTSGTVTKNGNNISFSATMEDFDGNTRSASGSINCG